MGGRINYSLQRLIEERKITRIKPDRKMILKEIQAAEYDLEKAQKSLKDGVSKWGTIKAYYCMFHSARALLYNVGYREKSHRALLIALRELLVKRGHFPEDLLAIFKNGMDLREEADYASEFSEETANDLIEDAKSFLAKVKSVLKA